jgi:aquaporin Z
LNKLNHKIMSYKKSTKYLAELFGTFVLVLMGCGSAVVAGVSETGPEGVGLLGISLAFGLAVVVMVYSIGPISGCHINPAITISMLVAGKINVKDTVWYILSQIGGAILASGVLMVIMNGMDGYNGIGEWGLGANGWGEGYLGEFSLASAFIAEAVFTFIFLMVIFGSTGKDSNESFAGLAIGLSLVLIHIVCIPITGTSVNPARSIGPALFAGGAALSQLWLFIVAPIAGGVSAAVIWKMSFSK